MCEHIITEEVGSHDWPWWGCMKWKLRVLTLYNWNCRGRHSNTHRLYQAKGRPEGAAAVDIYLLHYHGARKLHLINWLLIRWMMKLPILKALNGSMCMWIVMAAS